MKNLGRILYGLPYLFFGLNHFIASERLIDIMPHWLPVRAFFLYFTGLALVVSAIFIVCNIDGVGVVSFLLGVLLLAFIVTLDIPAVLDPQTRQAALSDFLKNTALMGAAFTFSAVFTKI